jgi:tRNA(Ile)-lysidine synthase
MTLLQRFQDFIKQQNLFHQKDKLLLAISGGVDSVVLCELCKQAGYDFSIAHCNFQLRGEESERDEKFVGHMAIQYGAEILVKKFDTEKYAQEKKMSIQEAARELRYEWFYSLIKSSKPGVPSQDTGTHDSRLTTHDWLLTAHHADDNIETVLMNFCRGTGLNGLEGIPVANSRIRRPLLEFWKEELVEFAKQNNLEFVEDSSNLSSKYTRNLFRNEIIPLISNAYPQVKDNLRDNIIRFKEIRKLYNISAGEIKKKLLKHKGDEIHLPVKQLMEYNNRALIFDIISDYGFTEKQLDEVIKLAESESGKFIQSPTASVRLIKFRNWFIISREQPSNTGTVVIEEQTKLLDIENGKLRIESVSRTSDFRLPTADCIACVDAKEINFPLILRKWKEGDYFYPLGMKKKKKLARFFIDQKLSKTDREKIWVLEMNKKIIWVVGLRIDDRFKITDKTKEILKISLEAS